MERRNGHFVSALGAMARRGLSSVNRSVRGLSSHAEGAHRRAGRPARDQPRRLGADAAAQPWPRENRERTCMTGNTPAPPRGGRHSKGPDTGVFGFVAAGCARSASAHTLVRGPDRFGPARRSRQTASGQRAAESAPRPRRARHAGTSAAGRISRRWSSQSPVSHLLQFAARLDRLRPSPADEDSPLRQQPCPCR